jgi:hypothetical protein
MADIQERRCPNCDAVLPQATGHLEKRRIWCSEKCRYRAARLINPDYWRIRKCWLCGKKGGGGSGMAGKRSFCSEECRQITKDCERSELMPHSGLTGLAWQDINEKYLGPLSERWLLYATLATRLRWLLPRTCPDCNKQHRDYFGSMRRKRCNDCFTQYERDLKAKGKAKRRGACRGERVTSKTIFARDQGRCWICTKPTEPWSSWRSSGQRLGQDQRWLPTLDHIRPLSKGGSHTEDNVRLAHLLCNSLRGNNRTRAEVVGGLTRRHTFFSDAANTVPARPSLRVRGRVLGFGLSTKTDRS